MKELQKRLKSIYNRLRGEEELEVPLDWASAEPEEVKVKPVFEWPPKPSVKITGQHMRRFLRWLSKFLFVTYLLLAGMAAFNFRVALILIVPTLMVVLDYIRNGKIMEEVQSWWDPEEFKRVDKKKNPNL